MTTKVVKHKISWIEITSKGNPIKVDDFDRDRWSTV